MNRSGQMARVALAVVLAAGAARADAIVRTQAMLASTIAEFHVEDSRVLLELEIGLVDLPAFTNLMPDEIHERLGGPQRPLAARLVDFFSRDLTVALEGGPPLPGQVLEFETRPRVRRDEISGEPLPAGDDEPERVIFTRIAYALPGRPEVLRLGGEITGRAGIGFVVYHGSVAVNDFRYLGPSQTLLLDWNDSWYTRFDRRSLRRTYFSPMSGFIYVEPYEVRKEIIVRPKDLQHWLDLGLEDRATIPVEMQDGIKREVGEFLREHQPVSIDGETVTPDLARINFLERTLRTSRVIDPPRELDINSAVLGVIFVYPTPGLPQRVTMEWDLFNDRIRSIPAAAVDPVGPLPSILEPGLPELEWQNFIKIPVMPTPVDVRLPPSTLARGLLWLRWLPLAAGLVLLVPLFRRPGPRRVRVAGLLAASFVLAALGFWFSREARLSDAAAREVVEGLLHNVYRAFDYRQEEQIYDVLARSVNGDLLREIYLETRRGLELANQGGARVKVKQIELSEIAARPSDAGGFVADATWTVTGSVGHWGHLHQRKNLYRAELVIRPAAGAWRLTGLEILEEERL